jgi:glycerophosphoryl diester phosphodiesterase
MMIEIKDVGANGLLAAEQLISLIRNYNMTEKVVAFSFSDEVMNHFHNNNTDSVYTGAALGDGFSFVGAAQTNPDTTLQLRFDICAFPTSMLGLNLDSDTIISVAHKNNVAIHYWTINDKEEMKELIQKGADGIITDRPDLMKEALAELGF